MNDAGIVGLGWWGQSSDRVGVGQERPHPLRPRRSARPAAKQEIARRHGLFLSPSFAAMQRGLTVASGPGF